MLTKKKKNQDRGSSQSGRLKNFFSRSKKTKDGAEYSRLNEEGSGMESLQPDTATLANEGSAPAASAGNAQQENPEATRQKVAFVTPVLGNIAETARSLEERLYAFENEGQKENNKLFREISEGLLEAQNTILRAADQISIQNGSITSSEELVQALESGAGTGKEVDEIMRKLVAGGNSSVIGKISELLATSERYQEKTNEKAKKFNIKKHFGNTQSKQSRVAGEVANQGGRMLGGIAGSAAGTAAGLASAPAPVLAPVAAGAAGLATKKGIKTAVSKAVGAIQEKVHRDSELRGDDPEAYDSLLGAAPVKKGKKDLTKEKIEEKVERTKDPEERKRLFKENVAKKATKKITKGVLEGAAELAGIADPTGVLDGAISYASSETAKQVSHRLFGKEHPSNVNPVKKEINDIDSLNDSLGSLLTDLDNLSKTYDRLQMGEPVE